MHATYGTANMYVDLPLPATVSIASRFTAVRQSSNPSPMHDTWVGQGVSSALDDWLLQQRDAAEPEEHAPDSEEEEDEAVEADYELTTSTVFPMAGRDRLDGLPFGGGPEVAAGMAAAAAAGVTRSVRKAAKNSRTKEQRSPARVHPGASTGPPPRKRTSGGAGTRSGGKAQSPGKGRPGAGAVPPVAGPHAAAVAVAGPHAAAVATAAGSAARTSPLRRSCPTPLRNSIRSSCELAAEVAAVRRAGGEGAQAAPTAAAGGRSGSAGRQRVNLLEVLKSQSQPPAPSAPQRSSRQRPSPSPRRQQQYAAAAATAATCGQRPTGHDAVPGPVPSARGAATRAASPSPGRLHAQQRPHAASPLSASCTGPAAARAGVQGSGLEGRPAVVGASPRPVRLGDLDLSNRALHGMGGDQQRASWAYPHGGSLPLEEDSAVQAPLTAWLLSSLTFGSGSGGGGGAACGGEGEASADEDTLEAMNVSARSIHELSSAGLGRRGIFSQSDQVAVAAVAASAVGESTLPATGSGVLTASAVAWPKAFVAAPVTATAVPDPERIAASAGPAPAVAAEPGPLIADGVRSDNNAGNLTQYGAFSRSGPTVSLSSPHSGRMRVSGGNPRTAPTLPACGGPDTNIAAPSVAESGDVGPKVPQSLSGRAEIGLAAGQMRDDGGVTAGASDALVQQLLVIVQSQAAQIRDLRESLAVSQHATAPLQQQQLQAHRLAGPELAGPAPRPAPAAGCNAAAAAKAGANMATADHETIGPGGASATTMAAAAAYCFGGQLAATYSGSTMYYHDSVQSLRSSRDAGLRGITYACVADAFSSSSGHGDRSGLLAQANSLRPPETRAELSLGVPKAAAHPGAGLGGGVEAAQEREVVAVEAPLCQRVAGVGGAPHTGLVVHAEALSGGNSSKDLTSEQEIEYHQPQQQQQQRQQLQQQQQQQQQQLPRRGLPPHPPGAAAWAARGAETTAAAACLAGEASADGGVASSCSRPRSSSGGSSIISRDSSSNGGVGVDGGSLGAHHRSGSQKFESHDKLVGPFPDQGLRPPSSQRGLAHPPQQQHDQHQGLDVRLPEGVQELQQEPRRDEQDRPLSSPRPLEEQLLLEVQQLKERLAVLEANQQQQQQLRGECAGRPGERPRQQQEGEADWEAERQRQAQLFAALQCEVASLQSELRRQEEGTREALDQLAKGMEHVAACMLSAVLPQAAVATDTAAAASQESRPGPLAHPECGGDGGVDSQPQSAIASPRVGGSANSCGRPRSAASATASPSRSRNGGAAAALGRSPSSPPPGGNVQRQLRALQQEMRRMRAMMAAQVVVAAAAAGPGGGASGRWAPGSRQRDSLMTRTGTAAAPTALGPRVHAVEGLGDDAVVAELHAAELQQQRQKDQGQKDAQQLVQRQELEQEQLRQSVQAVHREVVELRNGETLIVEAQEALVELVYEMRRDMDELRASVQCSAAGSGANTAQPPPGGPRPMAHAANNSTRERHAAPAAAGPAAAAGPEAAATSTGPAAKGRKDTGGSEADQEAGDAKVLADYQRPQQSQSQGPRSVRRASHHKQQDPDQMSELVGVIHRVHKMFNGSLSQAMSKIASQGEEIEELKRRVARMAVDTRART